MVDYLAGNLDFVSIMAEVGQGGAAHADAIHYPPRQGATGFDLDELVFD